MGEVARGQVLWDGRKNLGLENIEFVTLRCQGAERIATGAHRKYSINDSYSPYYLVLECSDIRRHGSP